jgi:hypothetical protein
MDVASAPAANPLPTTADLEVVMGILGIAGDPVYIMKDHSDARRRAELLARLAAGIVDLLGPAEALADLDLEDRAELHWDADCDIAAPSRRALDGVRLLDLQLARLGWVHHAIVRVRGPRPYQVADTVAAAVGAIIQLVETWRDRWPGHLGEHIRTGRQTEYLEPMLADALFMVHGAADHLARVLRSQLPLRYGRGQGEPPRPAAVPGGTRSRTPPASNCRHEPPRWSSRG